MRSTYALALIVTLLFSGTYWYQSTSYICPIPVSYRLGTIDPSFNISRADATAALQAATNVWEDTIGQDLFVLADQADVTVSFVFDDRQATANQQTSAEQRLDAIASENETLRSTIETLQATYNSMQSNFVDRRASYDNAVAAYNEQVRQINDRGGATEVEFAALEGTETELQQESQALQVVASELNQIADQLNALSAQSNRLIQSYNQDVGRFNDQFGTGDEITQGEYISTGEINVYKFSSEAELVSVLAHELGHALGIAHVDEPGALMYYLLEEGSETALSLAPADTSAYNAVCQPDTWDFKLRQIIRTYLD